ncbi:hypothetical protein F5Y15DRAFT_327502 [Xylariaceae sp. FL0016]|nr:hypothetical protein F5Y15DRAFT_327502 [Xylariaceae sp. FL0016]
MRRNEARTPTSTSPMDSSMYYCEGNPLYFPPTMWSGGQDMSRGLSPESASSGGYTTYNTPDANSRYEPVFSPMGPIYDGSDYRLSPEIGSANYVTDNLQGTGSVQQDFSLVAYQNFNAGDASHEPHWQLRNSVAASSNFPAIRQHGEQIYGIPGSQNDEKNGFMCPNHGCKSHAFKRKADLERHVKHRHQAADQKEAFACDYKKCPRHKDPFHRLDHCRDHYRDYHHEDLTRRGSKKEDGEWWKSRNIHLKWWRCTKCLHRIDIKSQGFDCPRCKATCETERRNRRGYS